MNTLIISGLVLEALIAVGAWLMRQPPGSTIMTRWLLPVLLCTIVPYLVVVHRCPTADWKRIRWLVVAVALATRVMLLITPCVLSDDIHRYLWEGKVQLAGFSPYVHAPDDAVLNSLRDTNWEQVAHRDVPSAYPPLLLLVFRAAARVTERTELFKWFFTAFDLATLWLLTQLLRARGRNESLALIWAWNPLVILEFAGSGHEMSMPIFFAVAGLGILEYYGNTAGTAVGEATPRRFAEAPLHLVFVAAAVCLGAAVQSHLLAVPVVLAAVIAARVKDWRFWVVFLVVLIAPCLLFADAGLHGLRGLAQFAGHWRFNGSLFELLIALPGSTLPWLMPDGSTIAYPWAKLAAVVALAGVCVWIWRRRLSPTRAALVMMGALLLFSPTVHPWYVTWLVALACLEFSLAWVVFSGLVMISYVAKIAELRTGAWVDLAVIRWMEYVPLFLLLTLECGCVNFIGRARKFFSKH